MIDDTKDFTKIFYPPKLYKCDVLVEIDNNEVYRYVVVSKRDNKVFIKLQMSECYIMNYEYDLKDFIKKYNLKKHDENVVESLVLDAEGFFEPISTWGGSIVQYSVDIDSLLENKLL